MNEALELEEISKDVFVNVHIPWHPNHARGVFGGVLIAQSLVAASKTVPDTALAHSLHCTFIIGGDAQSPFAYHVSRLNDSDDVHVREVKAQQKGKIIFIATASFRTPMPIPEDVIEAGNRKLDMPQEDIASLPTMSGGNDTCSPYICTRYKGPDRTIAELHQRKTNQWAKTKDTLGSNRNSNYHAAAMAYFTDNYFICTVPRIHNVVDGIDPDAELDPPRLNDSRRKVKMLLTLDHSIYFHAPSSRYRADEWLFVEMESPWCGDDRALVVQRIYTQAGDLVATCTQEGLVRMEPPESKI